MSATQSAAGTPSAAPPPAPHPMDPAKGESLSPKFAALLCNPGIVVIPKVTLPSEKIA